MRDEKTATLSQATNDWFLQFLVDRVNGTTTEIGITLQVGGLLVSGMLVSGDKYKQRPESESTKESEGPPFYIHLKNAKFYSPGASPIPANGVWWRGRIS